MTMKLIAQSVTLEKIENWQSLLSLVLSSMMLLLLVILWLLFLQLLLLVLQLLRLWEKQADIFQGVSRASIGKGDKKKDLFRK